jgi:hypothetical protein
MTLQRSDVAPEEVQRRRFDLASSKGGMVTAWDLDADAEIARLLRQHAARVERDLNAVAAKAGMKPAGTGLVYGVNGSSTQPAEFWVQKVFQ